MRYPQENIWGPRRYNVTIARDSRNLTTYSLWRRRSGNLFHFCKKSIRLTSLVIKFNDELHVLYSINSFHFISNDDITKKYLCVDGIHLTEASVKILADNIVNYLNEIVLGVHISILRGGSRDFGKG